ncbi:MAG TPA: hypothetical protein VGM69_03940 [Chloroflexota bacterium]|jgi:hypothetical protein
MCIFCGSPDPTHYLAPAPLLLGGSALLYGLSRIVPPEVRTKLRRQPGRPDEPTGPPDRPIPGVVPPGR